MYCTRKLTEQVTWVGGSDRRLAVGYTMRRFEDALFLSDSLLSGGNILRIMAEHENTTVGEVLEFADIYWPEDEPDKKARPTARMATQADIDRLMS